MVDTYRTKTWWLFGSVLFLLLVCGLFPYKVIHDDGSKKMPFRFLVLDARTQRPLQDAQILLYDEARNQSQEIRTGTNGQASVDLICMLTCRITSGLILTHSRRSIYYPDRLLLALRKGYKRPEPLALRALVGRGHVGDYLPPPPVQIELEPE